jgi:hypothetical protein
MEIVYLFTFTIKKIFYIDLSQQYLYENIYKSID